MNWHELTIHTTEEAAEAVADWLHRHGAGGVSIEESGNLERKRDTSLGQWYELPLNDIPEGEAVMQAYFPEETDMNEMAQLVREFLAELPSFGLSPGRAGVSVKTVREEEWADAWKQYFKPTHVSERLVIKPTWETYDARPDEVVIELDPGMAFGTGTHATTALCMRLLERYVEPGDHVIDVGAGSGILAVTAVRLGAERVLALDLDPVAVSSARENARLNGLGERISVRESDLLGALKAKEGTGKDGAAGVILPVRLVVANILAEIIVTFVDDVHASLADGGVYIASGVIAAKEADVAEALRAAGFAVEERVEENGWVALAARKKGAG